jgi:hypothetical protein
MVRHLASCLAALSLLVSSTAHAQGTDLHATVADATTGIYILDAEVTVEPLGVKEMTDYFGAATFSGLGKGRYTVRARRMGFAPLVAEVELSGKDSLEITMLMRPVTHELAPVTIDADAPSPFRREFEQRRRLGKGQYITDSVLRTRPGSSLPDILTSRLRGLSVLRKLDGSFIPYSRGCRLNVYWNGVRITRSSMQNVDIPTELIGGIEFYRPGSTPVEYQDPGNDCGVLLFWSRP